MFEVSIADNGIIELRGRCDAASSHKLEEVLDRLDHSAVVDFRELKYVSSDPLGVLFAAQKRLLASNHELKLVNLSPHIREVFNIAGFDTVFSIEETES
jgi:anti-anti-sigma factor